MEISHALITRLLVDLTLKRRVDALRTIRREDENAWIVLDLAEKDGND